MTWRRVIVVLLIVLAIVGVQGPGRDLLASFVDWVRGQGVVGAIPFALVYIIATVALLPGAVLTLAAGFVYGPGWATLLVLISSMLGATTAFLLARTWLQPWVNQRFSHLPMFLALNKQVRVQGGKLVFLLRLSPMVPFSVLNYALGMTGVRLHSYVLASATGMIPGILLYSYLGSLASEIGATSEASAGTSSAQQIAFWGGMGATLLVTLVLTRWSRQALRQITEAT